MTGKTDRIFMLLAAAQVSVQEFRRLVSELRNTDPDQLESRYTHIRARVRRISEIEGMSELSSSGVASSKRVRDDVVSFAREGAADPREAARRLSVRLASLDASLKIPGYSPKDGFNRWLEKVIRIASPNLVLNAAVAEFGGSSPRQTDGWRLSDS